MSKSKVNPEKESRKWLPIVMLAVVLATGFFIVRAPSTESESRTQPTITVPEPIQEFKDVDNNYTNDVKVELYHFHPTNQCYSCRMIGELTEKTVNTYFKEELDSGKLVFAHINGELPENRDLIMKYGATGSSLWIGTYIDGTFYKEENTNVWYKIRNEEDYLGYLEGILEKRLRGELN